MKSTMEHNGEAHGLRCRVWHMATRTTRPSSRGLDARDTESLDPRFVEQLLSAFLKSSAFLMIWRLSIFGGLVSVSQHF